MRPGHPADEIVSLPNERPNAHTEWAEKSANGDLTMNTAMERRSSPAVLATWVDFDPTAADDIRAALTNLLADVFVLYLKTKGFHWHMSGRHFRDYHLMLDEQADQIFAMTDTIAERVRKIGGRTIASIGDVARRQRLMDSHGGELSPGGMLTELFRDNLRLRGFICEAHAVCDENEDVASASILENWIDETERRAWFLYEATRD
jgi:starvation-inducible DNA-binding protein